MTEAPGIRGLVADDHAGFRHGLVALLASEPGVEVVGEARDGHEAVAVYWYMQSKCSEWVLPVSRFTRASGERC